MKKIPTYFERDWQGDKSRVTRQVNPEAQWVADGEGTATTKFDGAAVMVRGGQLFVRYDAKEGRTLPDGFEALGERDERTGHQPGWVPASTREREGGAVAALNPQYKWHVAAMANTLKRSPVIPDGSYEAVGPHFQGNPYGLGEDLLWKHGNEELEAPRDYDGLAAFFQATEIEGVVWHHPDGRMAKVKRRDFGLPWPVKVRVET